MSVATLTKQFILLMVMTACCLAKAQSDTYQAKPTKFTRSSHKQKNTVKAGRKSHQLAYPFSGRKYIKLQLGRGDSVIIDLKDFWDNQMPLRDQQNLVHHSREDYLKYLREHVHYSNPKISKP